MIRIQDLHFGYSGKTKALYDGLSLELQSGSIYGLLGRNGAGKTSLLKLMAGLLFPNSGTCEVLGYPSEQRNPNMLSELYFVPEEFYVPSLTPKQYVFRYAPYYPRFNEEQFYGYLKEFQLDANARLTGMSYGQKKKVILSFAMATNCKLLILDEPTNGLDIPSKSQFRKLLAGSIDDDQTYIISTHQVRDLSNLMDPILILDHGKVLFNESIQAIGDRLAFDIIHTAREPEGVIYAERVPGGYMTISENTYGEPTEVDIEILFNAIILHTEQINKLFENVAAS